MLGQNLNEDDFVFSRADGTPLNPNAVTLAFNRFIRRADLPHIRLHDLQHTHATLMLKVGVHSKIVSERLGHANIAITLGTYSHVLPGLQEAAVQHFNRMLEASVSGNISKSSEKGNVSKRG